MPKMVFFKDLVKYDIPYDQSYISKLMRKGKFPRAAKLSGGAVGKNVWDETVILEWRNARLNARADSRA